LKKRNQNPGFKVSCTSKKEEGVRREALLRAEKRETGRTLLAIQHPSNIGGGGEGPIQSEKDILSMGGEEREVDKILDVREKGEEEAGGAVLGRT